MNLAVNLQVVICFHSKDSTKQDAKITYMEALDFFVILPYRVGRKQKTWIVNVLSGVSRAYYTCLFYSPKQHMCSSTRDRTRSVELAFSLLTGKLNKVLQLPRASHQKAMKTAMKMIMIQKMKIVCILTNGRTRSHKRDFPAGDTY